MAALRQTKRVGIMGDGFNMRFGPFEKGASARRCQREIVIVRRSGGVIRGRRAQQVSIDLRMGLERWIKMGQLAQQFPLTRGRIRLKGSVPVGRGARPGAHGP